MKTYFICDECQARSTKNSKNNEEKNICELELCGGKLVATERYLPWRWYCILFLVCIIGFILIWLNPGLPYWVKGMSAAVRASAWSRFMGIYLLSAALTNLLIHFALLRIDFLLRLEGPIEKRDLWAPTLVGFCESILYPTVMILGHVEFIGFWLGIKVAGGWLPWGGVGAEDNGKDEFKKAKEGRRRFHKFLIGNALSIFAAVVTYGVLRSWALAK